MCSSHTAHLTSAQALQQSALREGSAEIYGQLLLPPDVEAPLFATLQPKPVLDSASVFPHFLPDLVPIYDLLLVELVKVRVASLFGVSFLHQRLGPAASTWMTDVDFLVHRHELVVQVLPFRSLDALVGGLPIFINKRWSPSAGPTDVPMLPCL